MVDFTRIHHAGHGEAALFHGARSLDLCLKNDLKDFDLAFGYEAVARAYAVLGNAAEMEQAKAKALAASANVVKEDDRNYVRGEISAIG